MALLHRILTTSLVLSVLACSAELTANNSAPSATVKQATPPSAASPLRLHINDYHWETKKVQCSNQYPEAVNELQDYVKAHVVDVIPRTVHYERITYQQMEALSKAPQ